MQIAIRRTSSRWFMFQSNVKNIQKCLPSRIGKGNFMLLEWVYCQSLKAFPFVSIQRKRSLAWHFVFYIEVQSSPLCNFYAMTQNTIINIQSDLLRVSDKINLGLSLMKPRDAKLARSVQQNVKLIDFEIFSEIKELQHYFRPLR